MIDFAADPDHVVQGDNLEVLRRLPDESFQLVYVDPPFNTGGTRQRRTLTAVRDDEGERTGFRGGRYRSEWSGPMSYPDTFTDYAAFIGPRLVEARRLLTRSGTLYFHIDWREAHYCKVLLDEVFGRDSFLNEVIWAYDYGGRARDRWPAKHDTILVYVKEPGEHLFDQDAITRVPYLAPTLVGPEKAARGKLPTDVWWHTIVATGGREKTGYPTRSPRASSAVPSSRRPAPGTGSSTSSPAAVRRGPWPRRWTGAS